MQTSLRRRFARLRDSHLLVGLLALVMAFVTGGLLELRGWLSGSFSLDSEADLAWPLWESRINVPAIVSAGVLVMASVVWLLMVRVHPSPKPRLRACTTALALGLLFIAIDEVCALHERLGHNWYWWYLPLGLVLGACAVRVVFALRGQGFRRPVRMILAGGACWIVALGLEAAQFVSGEPVPGYVVYVFIEESLELIGSGLIGIGGIGVLRSTHAERERGMSRPSFALVD